MRVGYRVARQILNLHLSRAAPSATITRRESQGLSRRPRSTMSTRVPLLSAQEGVAGSTLRPPAGGTTTSMPVSEVQANTGGGLLYRMLWYGRRDKRKELTPGVKTKKAAAFEGLDFDDFLSPIVEAHRKATKHADHLRVAAMRWVLNFVIGALVALVAVLIIYSTRKLTGYRFSAVYSLISTCCLGVSA